MASRNGTFEGKPLGVFSLLISIAIQQGILHQDACSPETSSRWLRPELSMI
jgi:hypothetical protein